MRATRGGARPPVPPSGAFGGSGTVYATPFLTSDPLGSLRPDGTPALLAAREEGGPRGGGDDDLEWLRERILHFRGLLAEGPVAPGLVRRLYALQRLDRHDVLAEREATMGLLGEIRGALDAGSSPPPVRVSAEAALAAEVAEAVWHGDFETADGLATAYAAVVDATAEQDLALGVVAVDEQAGRYAEALARIAAVLAQLDEDEAALTADLEHVAALIESKMDSENRSAEEPVATAKSGATVGLPAEYALEPAYPNPFTGRTTLPLALPEAADVRVAVYDVLGREVAVVADERLEAGRHALAFDGSRLASGVYVVRAVCRGHATQVLTNRITLVR